MDSWPSSASSPRWLERALSAHAPGHQALQDPVPQDQGVEQDRGEVSEEREGKEVARMVCAFRSTAYSVTLGGRMNGRCTEP